jgi:hypothetical protein
MQGAQRLFDRPLLVVTEKCTIFDEVSIETYLSRTEGMCQKEVFKGVPLNFLLSLIKLFILEAR